MWILESNAQAIQNKLQIASAEVSKENVGHSVFGLKKDLFAKSQVHESSSTVCPSSFQEGTCCGTKYYGLTKLKANSMVEMIWNISGESRILYMVPKLPSWQLNMVGWNNLGLFFLQWHSALYIKRIFDSAIIVK